MNGEARMAYESDSLGRLPVSRAASSFLNGLDSSLNVPLFLPSISLPFYFAHTDKVSWSHTAIKAHGVQFFFVFHPLRHRFLFK